MNSRKFFNQITYEYDTDDEGVSHSVLQYLDSDSLNEIGTVSVLPVRAPGVKTELGGALLAGRRARALLARYKDAAFEIQLKTNWKTGVLIESGDTVLVEDDGNLQIPNLLTGQRNLEKQLFEVVDRKLDVKSGNVSLTLSSGLDFNLNDRFATVAPSSVIESGTTTTVKIAPSFGEAVPEYDKWSDYVGLKVLIHDYAWTRSAEAVLSGFAADDKYTMILGAAIGFTPQAGDIVDVAKYPSSEDSSEAQLYKLVHSFVTPSLTVTGGTSQTQFSVSAQDAALIVEGLPVMIHDDEYSNISSEAIVSSVVGTTITVSTALGFTPSAGMKVELVGFNDGGGAYRYM